MSVTTENRRRAGRRQALLAAFQTARQTPVTDFSVGARNLWTSRISKNLGIVKSEDQWQTTDLLPIDTDRLNKTNFPDGTFESLASFDVLEFLLRSNWGTYTPATGAFTQAGPVVDFLTLGLVDDRRIEVGGEFSRTSDVWIHQLELFITPISGLLRARSNYIAAIVETPQDLFLQATQDLLPAPPMAPLDSARFPTRQVEIIRDPAGADQRFSTRDAKFRVRHRFRHGWETTDGVDVSKAGQPDIDLEFVTRMNDESFANFKKSLTATLEPWRFLATNNQGARLQIDMPAVEFVVNDLGKDAEKARVAQLVGRVHRDATNVVDITLIDA